MSTPAAQAARKRCLHKIEDARANLVQAFIEATPCCGWADGPDSPYHLLDKASDDLKALWHKVNDYAYPERLDSEDRPPVSPHPELRHDRVDVKNRHRPMDLNPKTGRDG